MTLELGKSGIPLGAYEEGAGSGGGASELDQYLSGSTNASTTTLTVKNGKALDISAPTIAVGDNLVNNINGENTQLYLKQGDIESGDNITVEQTSTGVKVSATGGAASTNMVTTDTDQTITGNKTFKHRNGIFVTGTSSNSNAIKVDGDDKTILFNSLNATDALIINSGYTATKLKIGDNFERVQITTNLYDKDGTLITGGSGGSIEDLEAKIAALTERVAALEAQIGGGTAPAVTFSSQGNINEAGAAQSTTTLQTEQIGSVDFGVSGSATAQ